MNLSLAPSLALALLLAPLALAGCGSSAGSDAGDSQTTGDSTGTGTGTKGDTATTGTGASDTKGGTATEGGGSESESKGEDSSTSPTSSPTSTSPTTMTTAETSSSDPSTGTTEGVSGTTGEGGTSTTDEGDTSGGDSSGTTGENTTAPPPEPNPLLDEPILWYSVDKALVYIHLNPDDGKPDKLVHNQLVADVPLYHGQNGLTVIEGGALLGSRESAQGTQIYYIGKPPITENSPAEAVYLGNIAADKGQSPIRIEALYTDCQGRVYLMDTGVDVTNPIGNRLLRFTGDYLGGDLSYAVITDLEKASVGDIDDMSPGIVDGEINDRIGFAIDSAVLWRLDYTTGTGENLANTAGTWGVHALGSPLFTDAKPRLYVLNSNAALFEINLADFSSSPMLITGPNLGLNTGYNGWSGLAGPLTDCVTTIPQ